MNKGSEHIKTDVQPVIIYEFADGTAYTDLKEFAREFHRRPTTRESETFYRMLGEDLSKLMTGSKSITA